jgi:hypothetical protein
MREGNKGITERRELKESELPRVEEREREGGTEK